MQTKKLIFSSIIGAVIFAVIIQGVNLSNLLQKITSASIEWILLSAFAYLVFLILRAVRWKILLANGRKFSSLFHIFQIGYLLNNVFPFHLGEVIRALILKEKENVDVGYGLSSILVERMMDVITLLTLALVVTTIIPTIGGPQISGVINNAAIVLAMAVVAIVIFAIRPMFVLKFLDYTERVPRFSKLSAKAKALALAMANGLQIMSKKPTNFAGSFALTFLIWFINFIGIYSLFNSIGFYINPLAIFLGFIGTTLLLALPSSPGYIGTYEGFWIAAFFALGFTQVDEILLVGLLSHAMFIIISTSLGILGLFALRLPFRALLAKA